MTLTENELQRAQAKSQIARRRLAGTLVDIQDRLNPRALAREAAEELKQAGQALVDEAAEGMRQRPLTTAGVAAAITLYALRKPLRRLLRHRDE